uniref:Uncharacterized protein n=1 Tax=Candidatus Methanophaga sp. ANME-1 ERB7 TaxID=2759913 RepID=A0A7G9Z867_9EURY|nr:hypothetical protein OHJJKADD_00024 [Methanosarcinales archaeon ANME-1 ERB7]
MESEAKKLSTWSRVHCFFYFGGGIVVVDRAWQFLCIGEVNIWLFDWARISTPSRSIIVPSIGFVASIIITTSKITGIINVCWIGTNDIFRKYVIVAVR